MAAELHLAEDAFALHLLLQHPERLVDIVVADENTLVSVTAYHAFGGEVEASNTPTIRRLTPSCRHQLSSIARPYPEKHVQ